MRQDHGWQAHQCMALAPVEPTEALGKTQDGAASAPAVAAAVGHTAAAGVADAGAVPRRHGHAMSVAYMPVSAPVSAVYEQKTAAAVPGTDACHTVSVGIGAGVAAAAAAAQPSGHS